MVQMLQDAQNTKSKGSVARGTGFIFTGGTHSLINSVWHIDKGNTDSRTAKKTRRISVQRCRQLRGPHRVLDNGCPHAGKDNLVAQGVRISLTQPCNPGCQSDLLAVVKDMRKMSKGRQIDSCSQFQGVQPIKHRKEDTLGQRN